jgi:hypothetical protein
MKLKLTVIFITMLFGTLQAQKDSTARQKLEKYVHNIQTFNRLIPQEKVYLHFDNTSYVLGETIWFKAYVVTAAHNLPTAQSGVLYVELLNAKGKLLETKKLKIEAGQCHGEFSLTTLDMEYFPGYYEIRAYTKGMLNFGEETLFSRVFPVFADMKGNGAVSEDELDDDPGFQLPNHRPKAKKQKKVNLTFYPEGGHLVDGLMSVVAFKLTGQDGHGLEASGQVCNPEDEVLTTFATVHAGMGSFTCIPDGWKNKVKIFHENKTYSFDLPKSLPQGYVLKVINLYSDNLMVQIEKSAEIPSSLLGLSILCRGEVSFFQTVNLDKEPCGLKISKEILAAGVNQITLFDAKGEIFAERLFFISPREEDSAFIQAVPNKEAYSPLDLIQLDLLVGGHSGNKETSLSLAVRDAASLIETATDNIYTYLLLSSDLKGFIEAPDFYFASGKAVKTHELDLLMLVQGWKRYEWQTMAGVEPFRPLYNTEKGLTIKGFIASSEGKNTELIAQLQRSKDEVMDGKAQTDGKGVFYLYPEDFYGTWNLSMRAKGLTNAYKKIRLDRWFSPAPKTYTPFETRWKHPKAFPVREGNKKESLEEIDTGSGNRSRSFLIPEVQDSLHYV